MLTSQYVVKDGKSLSRHEVHQHTWYRIIQGHVIECTCNDEKNSFVSLTEDEIKNILNSFDKMITHGNRVIEFGMVRYGSDLVPYLIDFVDSDDTVKTADLNQGIISSGYRQGRIVNIRDVEDSLDRHFHDKRERREMLVEDIIFVCDRPGIGLLDLLDQYNNDHIGFAFSDGSILCHLAVVLREKGIPAVKIGDADFKDGEEYILDADTPDLAGKERLVRV